MEKNLQFCNEFPMAVGYDKKRNTIRKSRKIQITEEVI